MPNSQQQLETQVYQQRLVVEKLRLEVFQQPEPPSELVNELDLAEAVLLELENNLASLHDPDESIILSTGKSGPMMVLGAQTTGLNAEVKLRMAQVPTSIYHLLEPQEFPLLSCTVTNYDDQVRRIRVTSYIEEYSARAVTSFELEQDSQETFLQSPSLFQWRLDDLTELTRATLNICVEDIDSEKIETHITHPIWMLARSTAPLAVRDPLNGKPLDFSHYLGAFVTPNAPDLMHFLRSAARRHPDGRLVGYQGDPSSVMPQVKALYEALKQEADITYVNSLISFTPEQGMANQRVRLPRESLKDQQANCIDGTVLFASLLEAISLSPAIVIVPGHAFVAWETWKDAPDEWKYLETTMIGTHGFEEAHRSAEANAARYQALAEKVGNPSIFRLWKLRELRTQRRIMPME